MTATVLFGTLIVGAVLIAGVRRTLARRPGSGPLQLGTKPPPPTNKPH